MPRQSDSHGPRTESRLRRGVAHLQDLQWLGDTFPRRTPPPSLHLLRRHRSLELQLYVVRDGKRYQDATTGATAAISNPHGRRDRARYRVRKAGGAPCARTEEFKLSVRAQLMSVSILVPYLPYSVLTENGISGDIVGCAVFHHNHSIPGTPPRPPRPRSSSVYKCYPKPEKPCSIRRGYRIRP